MTRFSWIPTILAVLMVAGVGFAHGVWTDRWSAAVDLDDVYGPKVDTIALKIGDWQGEPQEGEPQPGETNVLRRYTNSVTGKSVLVSLTFGKPSQVAIHTPDMCYPASGYEMASGVTPREMGVGKFFAADFRKPGQPATDTFRVNWSWSANGDWAVSQYPRLWFGRSPYLFKLYVIHPSGSAVPPEEAAAYQTFTKDLLAELNTRLFDN